MNIIAGGGGDAPVGVVGVEPSSAIAVDSVADRVVGESVDEDVGTGAGVGDKRGSAKDGCGVGEETG